MRDLQKNADNLSSRRMLGDGGAVNASGGSRGANAELAPNVILFPSGRSFSPDYQGSGPWLSILDDDTCALCALGVVLGGLCAFGALCFYIGFILFDFG